MGRKQKDIAEEVGRVPDTIRRWKNDETWAQAVEEARDRWLTNMDRKARQRALELVETTEDFGLLIQFLERLDERLRTPPDRVEMSGPGGGPVQVNQPLTPEQKLERVEGLIERARERAENGAEP